MRGYSCHENSERNTHTHLIPIDNYFGIAKFQFIRIINSIVCIYNAKTRIQKICGH